MLNHRKAGNILASTDIECIVCQFGTSNHFMTGISLPGSIFFGNEPNRVLGPKEQKIYDDYQRYCWQFDILPASEERWRMESQKIPNV